MEAHEDQARVRAEPHRGRLTSVALLSYVGVVVGQGIGDSPTPSQALRRN